MKKYLIIVFVLFVNRAIAQTYYISSSGNNNNDGLSTSTPWQTVKTRIAGATYLLKRGDTFTTKIALQKVATSQNRIKMGAYGTGANPLLDQRSTIKAAAWVLTGTTNVWRAVITNSANITGFVPTTSNVGLMKIDNVIHGIRRGSIDNLKWQWDFYCDFATTIYVYSTANPSTLADDIKVTNGLPDRIYSIGNYESFEHINITGNADAGINVVQPISDTIRYCRFREIGGEMKSLTDTTRQGECIQFYNGATNCMVSHDTMELCFEDGGTMQSHNSGPFPTAFVNCIWQNNIIDSCENGFNFTIQVDGAPGYVNCKIRNNTIKNPGYSWSHPPNGKIRNDMSVAFMANWWQQSTGFDLVINNNTIINPRDGVYFVNLPDDSLPWTTTNNEIYMAAGTHIRRNCHNCSNIWTWLLADSTDFVNTTGADVGSHWYTLGALKTYYLDADVDGYGISGTTTTGTSLPNGYALVAGDCNDNNANINPGETELCNSIDDDCDGLIDEGCKTYYKDADGDGYGTDDDTIINTVTSTDYIPRNSDCDDTNSDVNPGVAEVCNNSIDDNCNGQTDENCTEIISAAFLDSVRYISKSKANVTLKVVLSKTYQSAVNISYMTVDGTAKAGVDYTQRIGSVRFSPGVTSMSFNIKLNSSIQFVSTKYFTVRLTESNPAAVNIANPNVATVYITK